MPKPSESEEKEALIPSSDEAFEGLIKSIETEFLSAATSVICESPQDAVILFEKLLARINAKLSELDGLPDDDPKKHQLQVWHKKAERGLQTARDSVQAVEVQVLINLP